jgi:hypothetical protein
MMMNYKQASLLGACAGLMLAGAFMLIKGVKGLADARN